MEREHATVSAPVLDIPVICQESIFWIGRVVLIWFSTPVHTPSLVVHRRGQLIGKPTIPSLPRDGMTTTLDKAHAVSKEMGDYGI